MLDGTVARKTMECVPFVMYFVAVAEGQFIMVSPASHQYDIYHWLVATGCGVYLTLLC